MAVNKYVYICKIHGRFILRRKHPLLALFAYCPTCKKRCRLRDEEKGEENAG